jgi:hypothetical protein
VGSDRGPPHDRDCYLRGRDVVLEIDVAETDLKLNGELRANARPTSSRPSSWRSSPSTGRCSTGATGSTRTTWDQGPEWQHNVRAIALTLQALRAVDRYGATETGQQYAGLQGAPRRPRDARLSHMTSDEAWSILGSFGPRAAMTYLLILLAVVVTVYATVVGALVVVVGRQLRRAFLTQTAPVSRRNPICLCTHVESIHRLGARGGCTARTCDCIGFIERGT